jgi:MADS-box transcription factor, plant
MAKNKKQAERIKLVENQSQRNVTYSKRKRGILKKAIELSVLCAQDIYLVIFDKDK